MAALKTAIPILVSTLLSVPVLGDDLNCQSSYDEETLDGNLMVAAPCRLNGTKVKGNVKLFAGGSLVAIGATIDGNIKAKTADFLDLQNTEVDGNVELKDMVGDVSYVRDSTIDGKVVVKENRSRLEFHNNYIDDNLEVVENSGGVIINNNVIDGDLKCKSNAPAPNGDNNQVSGKKEGQCADLEALGPSGEPDNDGATGTTGESDLPPFEINSGTGGGASIGPLFFMILLIAVLSRSKNCKSWSATKKAAVQIVRYSKI